VILKGDIWKLRFIVVISIVKQKKDAYGYAQDRFVAGSLGIDGLEFVGIVKNGTLRADQTVLVDKGKLLHK